MKARATSTTTTLGIALAGFALVAMHAAVRKTQNTGMADPVALEAAFDRFATGAPPANVVLLSLSNLRGLSGEAVNAGGRVSVDLATGVVESVVRLATQEDASEAFDLYLIDNQPGDGRTTLAEETDLWKLIGTYNETAPGIYTLPPETKLDFNGFFPDRAFVVKTGEKPWDSFALTGSSAFFDRLQRRQVRFVDDATAALGVDPTAAATRAPDFARVVAQGRQLFLNETFNGNGRTCGTCHVETNNFTVDPDLIATLPPSDPLFVAETNPALATLENPDLLRRFGLILVNADGFDPPAGGPPFVLRATQNVQALANSSVPPLDGSLDFTVGGPNPNPPERLGWGNDGAPLRDFALVAIAQHATFTLNRARGVDFRVPTDEELDALAAYQLSLGRQEDFNLPSLELKSTLAENGKRLYLDTGNLGQPGHKNCNACHFNGGGAAALSFNPTTPGFPKLDGSPRSFNMTAETNANGTPVALGLPRDGGFGQTLILVKPEPSEPEVTSFGNTSSALPGVGLEGFNSPPLVESADTAPFFHNHSVIDLESAVAFYGTPAFQTSIFGPAAIPVSISADPNDPEVQAIAAFLRVLNALENIRSSINVAERGLMMTSADDMRDLARLSLEETIDAMQVLSEGALERHVEPTIFSARARLLSARLTLDTAQHLKIRRAIDNLLEAALRHLRAARSHLADPTTLPPSFRN